MNKIYLSQCKYCQKFNYISEQDNMIVCNFERARIIEIRFDNNMDGFVDCPCLKKKSTVKEV